MRYVILALLAVTTGIHLYHSWVDDAKKRKYTKPFLLVLILLYYLCCAQSYSWLLIAALVTAWLGDVLLMPAGNKWFTAGGISFMMTHFLFVAVYAREVRFEAVKWWAVIPVALLYFGIAAVIIRALTPSTPKMMLAPMYVYLLANSTMNVFSFMQLMTRPSLATAVAFGGAVLFFISDCTLFLVRYYKKKDIIFKRHFTVMLTYVVGVWMITQGMLILTAQ